jgi:hypothetical protein
MENGESGMGKGEPRERHLPLYLFSIPYSPFLFKAAMTGAT